jgi:hypothetical protein
LPNLHLTTPLHRSRRVRMARLASTRPATISCCEDDLPAWS